MKILLPKIYVGSSAIADPLFFIAGPIRGGGNWQEKCLKKLATLLTKFVAVIPCRWESGHPLYHYHLEGRDNVFERQTDWEFHYLMETAGRSSNKRGCIIFWLPEESKEHPRDDGQPYACDTRGEIGFWRAQVAHDRNICLVIGADPGFPGLRVIQRNFHLIFGESFTIYPTLDLTVEAAVRCIV